jgi:hypothetical protein
VQFISLSSPTSQRYDSRMDERSKKILKNKCNMYIKKQGGRGGAVG